MSEDATDAGGEELQSSKLEFSEGESSERTDQPDPEEFEVESLQFVCEES